MKLEDFLNAFNDYIDPETQSIGARKTDLQSRANMLWTGGFIHAAIYRFPHLRYNFDFLSECRKTLDQFEVFPGIQGRKFFKYRNMQDSIFNLVARLSVAQYLQVVNDGFPQRLRSALSTRAVGYGHPRDRKVYYLLKAFYFGKPKGVLNSIREKIFSLDSWFGKYLFLPQLINYSENKVSYFRELFLILELYIVGSCIINGNWLGAASMFTFLLLSNLSFFAYAFALLLPFQRDEHEEWILTWHLCEAAKDKSVLLSPLIKFNSWGRFQRYKEGVGALHEAYFGRYHALKYALKNI